MVHNHRRCSGVPSRSPTANSCNVCNAPLKLTRRGSRPCSCDAATINARITLYPNIVIQISLRTISGVLHRSMSIPSTILIDRKSSSACHRCRYKSPRSYFVYISASNRVVARSNTRVRKPGFPTWIRTSRISIVSGIES